MRSEAWGGDVRSEAQAGWFQSLPQPEGGAGLLMPQGDSAAGNVHTSLLKPISWPQDWEYLWFSTLNRENHEHIPTCVQSLQGVRPMAPLPQML